MTEGHLILQSSRLSVSIRQPALQTFDAHRQRRFYHREAGGQLFGRSSRELWIIEYATGPRKDDRRGRFSFMPDRVSEQREIESFHARGLDYLGDWHTHPEDEPAPSTKDINTINSIARESQHHLPGFLLCIIGRAAFSSGLWVSFHDTGGGMTRLEDLTLHPDVQGLSSL